jgi:ribosomal protein S18 acetylase RimI-like enzyme
MSERSETVAAISRRRRSRPYEDTHGLTGGDAHSLCYGVVARRGSFGALAVTSINMTVRRARLEDAEAIAAIHVHSWQVTYQGIVPSTFLGSLSVEERERVWRQNLKQATSETWVAEEGGHVLGWISAARSRDLDALPKTGEVWAIYVDPAHWRRGLGRCLWHAAEGHLEASGFSEITLWVLKTNAQAIAFYESIGLAIEPGSEKTINRGGTELLEIRLRKRLGG